jgi:hypothetical protein
MNLSRSYSGLIIHERSCRYARVPWLWADDKTAAEVEQVAVEFGYRYCGSCAQKAGTL